MMATTTNYLNSRNVFHFLSSIILKLAGFKPEKAFPITESGFDVDS